MAEVQGKLVNVRLRVAGTHGAFSKLVCLENTTFGITTDTTVRNTNCGPKTSVGVPNFTLTGSAVHNSVPSTLEISYAQMKTWIKNGTKLDFQHKSDADSINAYGVGVNNYGSAYITDLSETASADSDGIVSFDFTLTGTGTIDDFDDNSTS